MQNYLKKKKESVEYTERIKWKSKNDKKICAEIYENVMNIV